MPGKCAGPLPPYGLTFTKVCTPKASAPALSSTTPSVPPAKPELPSNSPLFGTTSIQTSPPSSTPTSTASLLFYTNCRAAKQFIRMLSFPDISKETSNPRLFISPSLCITLATSSTVVFTMRWKRGAGNRNIEDRRGQPGRPIQRRQRAQAPRGTGFGVPLPGRKMSMGSVLVVVVIMFLSRNIFSGGGVDTSPMPNQYEPGQTSQQTSHNERRQSSQQAGHHSNPFGVSDNKTDDTMKEFVGFVLNDVQTTWQDIFTRSGQRYQESTLVLFTGATRSACGFSSAATGPFYCQLDGKVYIDLSFYSDLKNRFGAPGDFAQAYVIAHEISHHIQNIIGVADKVHKQTRRNPRARNDLSIRQELQADCFAGVWAQSANKRGLLEQGDIEEGLNAAAAIGDDRIQKQSTGHVSPESWTHGSSKQRVTWFRRGFQSKDLDQCDTFSVRTL